MGVGDQQSITGVSMAPTFTEGNRNFCTKHKRKLVNFCLDHGVALCSTCFKEHQGHRFEMLENYAQAEVTKVHQLVEHLDNSIRHVKEKLELRRNLNEKKEIAARQFFELTRAEMERLERAFWEKFSREQDQEEQLIRQLQGQQEKMEAQYAQIKPQFDQMEAKIQTSEFFDILESKADVWHLNEAFKDSKREFYDLVQAHDDYELIFDKMECSKKLEEYLKV
jgi:hypothetical protein